MKDTTDADRPVILETPRPADEGSIPERSYYGSQQTSRSV